MDDIKDLIAQMTLEEKASLCSGRDFWHLKGIARLGVPSVMVTDGPHGLRKQATGGDHVGLTESVPATCFPTASALAATWNRDLVTEVGQALGDECRAEKVAVILGPGANIKRSPLCGRNFEYFSEDPYQSGEMAKSHIKGVQSRGIGASLKHYVANNQEQRRMVIDAVIDERALHEIYLAGFEIAVKEAQPWTVMCAYNKVNGTYCAENKTLMTEVLKEAWGHEGLVVTDWGAMNDRVLGLAAGVELEMPGDSAANDARIAAAVRTGELEEGVLDAAVARVLTLIFKAQAALAEDYSADYDAHHALARRAAAEGVVLLKNEGGVLPLAQESRIALIGRFAKAPRYQGAGSSQIVPTRIDTLYDEMVAIAGEERVRYAPGYDARGDLADESLIAEALAAAAGADVVVICAGLTDMYEVEGLDRQHMKLPPGHDALIARVVAAHDKVVVLLSNGAPVEMPWVDEVPAILEGYLGGQAGAGAQADILFGKVNPSGKLAETFPLRLEDNPSYAYFPGGPATVEYRESIYVGYRYYDSAGQAVLFPFGHGLSYTSFAYSDLQLVQVDGDGESVLVRFTVQNSGAVPGQEVAQVYVRDVDSSVFRPDKELKGFAKVALEPGEETVVTIALDPRAFAFYDTQLGGWAIEPGAFEILVGASAADIRLQGRVEITPVSLAAASENGHLAALCEDLSEGVAVNTEAFEYLLGRPLPVNESAKKGEYTINTPLCDMADSLVGRQLHNLMQRQLSAMIAGQEDTPMGLLMEAVAREMPLRTIMMMGNGAVTREMLESCVAMSNGRIVRGAGGLLKEIVTNVIKG